MAEQTFQQQFDEAFEQRSATIGDVTVEVLDESQVDDATSIPATRIENGEAVGWYVAPLSVIMKPIRAAISTLQQLIETVTGQGDRAEQAANSVGSAVRNAQEATSAANTAATNANDSRTLIESNEATRQSNEQTRQSQEQSRVAAEQRRTETFGNDHQTATADHQQAVSDSEQAGTDHQILASDHEQAVSDTERAEDDHTRADTDHQASVTATTEASNVNATLEGMTVTITNRNGQSRAVNIGFDIYATYASVAAMNADAANVPEGKFVMIATTDTTSEENARLYGRNSSPAGSTTPFTFLSDLDQASSTAWAEWVNSYRPVMVSDHETATADHQQAVSDSEQAGTDHQIFVSDHEQAVSDTERAKNDHLRAEDDHAHQPYIADGTEAKPGDIGYSYYWDSESQQYVRGIRISLDWGTMAEEEKDALAAEVLANIAFDTLPTQDSNKAVTSGGLYNALGGQSRLVFASTETCESIIDELV